LKGRDVRGNTSKLASYPYTRAARERFSVSEWSKKRFSANYPDYDVYVLLPNGKPSHGRTLLSTIRDAYVE